MEPFLRPTGTDDPIGRLNSKLRDDEQFEPFRQRVLQNVESIADPQQRQFAIGENMLINEDRISAMSEAYGLDIGKARENVAEWYNHFADEYEADPENTPNPIERTNRWMQAKLKSAASEQEVESIKTGGMADVGRFIGEVASLPAEVPLRLGFDIADAVTGNNQPSALFGTNPTTDPIENYQTDNQLVAGVANIEPDRRAKFFDSFDPETGEIVPAEPFRAASGVVGMGAREVTKALALGMGLGATGATSAIGSRAAALAGGTGGRAMLAREVAESVPLFVALGAAGRGEAGEGLGSVGDVAADVATGALFGAVSGAVQTLGRSATTKWLKKNDPKLADMLKAAEESGGQMTPRLRESLSKLGTLEDLDAATQKALTAAQTIDKNIGIAEVGTQFLAGYLVDRAQGVSHEEAAVNGILFSVLDVARARGMNVSRAEIEPVRRLAVALEVPGSKTAQQPVIKNSVSHMDSIAGMTEVEIKAAYESGAIPENQRYDVDIELPADAALYSYEGRHSYPFTPEPAPDTKPTRKPIRHLISEWSSIFGHHVRENMNLPATERGKVLGRYMVGGGRTELASRNDPSTFFHEIGHGLDSAYRIIDEDFITQNPQAVAELDQFFSPASADGIQTAMAEGFSGFMQSYVQAPEATKAAAPTVYNRMVEKIMSKRGGKKLLAQLDDASAEIRRYLNESFEERTIGQFQNRVDPHPGLMQRIRAEFARDSGFKEPEVFVTTTADKLKNGYIDRSWMVTKALLHRQALESPTGRVDNPIEAMDNSLPYLLTQAFGGVGDQFSLFDDAGNAEGWGIPNFDGNSRTPLPGTEGGFTGQVFRKHDLVPEVDAPAVSAAAVHRRVVERVELLRDEAIERNEKKKEELLKSAQERVDRHAERVAKIKADLKAGKKRRESTTDWNDRRERLREAGRQARENLRNAGKAMDSAKRQADSWDIQLEAEIKQIENHRYIGAAYAEGTTIAAGKTDEYDYAGSVRALEEGPAKYGEKWNRILAATDSITDFTRAAMQQVVDLGYMTQAEFDALEKRNQHYITMERLADEDSIGNSKMLTFEGSDKPIAEPLSSTVEKAKRVIFKALENRRNVALIDEMSTDVLWQSGRKQIDHLSPLMVPLGEAPAKSVEGYSGVNALRAQLERQRDSALKKMQKAEADLVADVKSGDMSKEGVARRKGLRKTIDRQRKIRDGAIDKLQRFPSPDASDNGQIIKTRHIVMRGGKEVTVVRNTHIPEKAFYESITALSRNRHIPDAVKVVGAFGQLMKQFVIRSPGFIARNPTRGTVNRVILGEKGGSVFDVLNRDFVGNKAYKEYMASGASGAGIVTANSKIWDVDQHRAQKKTAASGALSIFAPLGKLVDGYMHLAERAEAVERSPEYFRAYNNKIAEGATPLMANLYAVSKARGLADFYVIGEYFQSINYLLPFSNPAIQSLRASVRNFRRNPKRAAIAWGLGVALPAVLSYEFARMMGYDEEYLELPSYQRDFFLNFKIGDNTWMRIAKPFEFGVLGTGIERAYAALIRGEENQSEGFAGSLTSAISPIDGGVMLGPFRIFAEMLLNKDYFRDRPIIPTWEAKLDVNLREGTKNASRFGQMLQSLSGMDARKWDFYLKAQFAEFGQYATRLSDIMREDRPFDWRDFVTVRGPVSNAKSVRMVLDAAERYGETNNKLVRRLKGLLSMYYEMETRGEQDEIGKTIREYANSMLPFIDMWKQNIRPMP